MGTAESLPPEPFNVVVKYWNFNPPENSTAAAAAYLSSAEDRGAKVVKGGPRLGEQVHLAPGAVGEFWLTVSAKNCRLNPCSASRPTSEDADDMMQERARRGYRR